MYSLVYICKAVKRRQERGKEVKGRRKQRYKRKIRRKRKTEKEWGKKERTRQRKQRWDRGGRGIKREVRNNANPKDRIGLV